MLYKKAGNKVQLVLTDILLSFGSIGVSKLRMFFFGIFHSNVIPIKF